MNPLMNQYADVLLRAEDNLLEIGRLLEGEPSQTFAMKALLAGVGFDAASEAVTHRPPSGC